MAERCSRLCMPMLACMTPQVQSSLPHGRASAPVPLIHCVLLIRVCVWSAQQAEASPATPEAALKPCATTATLRSDPAVHEGGGKQLPTPGESFGACIPWVGAQRPVSASSPAESVTNAPRGACGCLMTNQVGHPPAHPSRLLSNQPRVAVSAQHGNQGESPLCRTTRQQLPGGPKPGASLPQVRLGYEGGLVQPATLRHRLLAANLPSLLEQ